MPAMTMITRTDMRLTPMLLHLTRMLELTSMSLQQLVQQELAQNPALEANEEGALCIRCGRVRTGMMCPCAGQEAEYRGSQHLQDGGDPSDALRTVAAPRDVLDPLIEDLYASLPDSEHLIALTLIGSLDKRGLLRETTADIAAALGVEQDRVVSVLRLLRDLGPPGIAAHTPRDCLLAQIDALRAEGIECPHARAIVADYLEDLGAGRSGVIARKLHIGAADVTEAHRFIRRWLWPYPLANRSSGCRGVDQTSYRTPDIVITATEGGFSIEVMSASSRALRLSPLYQRLTQLTDILTEQERSHVQEYLTRARTFLASLQQREATIRRIGEAIVKRQRAFLRRGVRFLTPMTRQDIAADLGVHESTVCRGTADKTVLLPNGRLWPMSDFFVAARSVQHILRELVSNETRALSDQDLARMLGERGYTVARRTVAKYRDELKIPPYHLRTPADARFQRV